MKPLSVLGWALPLLLLLPARAATTPAPLAYLLVAKLGDQLAPVGAVHGGVVYVWSDGRLQPAVTKRPLQRATPYFHDGFIMVANLRANASRIDAPVDDSNFNINLAATLTADQALEDCYLAFELPTTSKHGPEIGVFQVPNLAAGKAQTIHVTMALPDAPVGRDFRVLLFSGRHEVLNSTLAADLSGVLTESTYLAQPDRTYAPVLTLGPAYPPSLVAKDLAGHATIKTRFGPDGTVAEASVLSADQPEFGAAALAAVKQWIFVPPVVNHQFVEKWLAIPVSFAAPSTLRK